MEDKMISNLKLGFLLSRWGIDGCLSALFVTIAAIVSATVFKKDFLTYGLLSVALVILGLIVFAIGRAIVGLETRKLNFMTDRKRTEIEDWLLNTMLGIEKRAADSNLLNQLSRITPYALDDSLMAVSNVSTISNYFKVGNIFTGNNFLQNRLILIIGAIVSVIIIITSI